MPNPPDYVPAFSFTDHSANFPDVPQPGTALDAEFTAIRNTISETVGSLRARQITFLLRSDDSLQNDIVGNDQLKSEVLDGINASESSASASAASAATSANLAQQSADAAAAYGGLNTTSATSNTIELGSKSFVVAADRPFQVSQYVQISKSAMPADWMHGQVTAYSFPNLTVNVTKIQGGGTDSAWQIVQSSPAGVDGAAAGALMQAANLSDVASATTSLANIGGFPLAGGAFTGRINIKSYDLESDGASVASGTLTVDFDNGNDIDITLSENITSWVFQNAPASGKKAKLEVRFKQPPSGGPYTVALPTNTKTQSNTGWTMTQVANAEDELVFTSRDGFASDISLYVAGQDMRNS